MEVMKEFLDKLASYHLFNYLLPGALFVILADKITNYSLYQTDIVLSLLLYYFIGLSISRIGSLIVEPFLRKIRFIVFADYKDYITASKLDPKIEIISETNNMYRTLCTLFVILPIFKIYNLLEVGSHLLTNWNEYIFLGLLLVIFLFAYRKQSAHIVNRVEANNDKKSKRAKQ
jgi:hypothetical protein